MQRASSSSRCGWRVAPPAIGPLRSFTIPVDVVIPAAVAIPHRVVVPRTVVIPAQAGIHGCASCRCRCQVSAVPASRQAVPVWTAACGVVRLRTGATWRSRLVAAKSRVPRPQHRPPQCEPTTGSAWRGAGRPRSRHDERQPARTWIPACAGMTALAGSPTCAGMTALAGSPTCDGLTPSAAMTNDHNGPQSDIETARALHAPWIGRRMPEPLA